MDLVYTLIKDKRSGTDQLKYSLRSVDKYMAGVDRVFVIGHNPELPGIVHVPFPDHRGPAKNIFNKVMKIAALSPVSENFMCLADDYFLAENVSAHTYPHYVNGTLEKLLETQNNSYKVIIKNTISVLRQHGYPTKNYNIHVPIVYNRSNLVRLKDMFELPSLMGYLLKSLYLNVYPPSFAQEIKDCKIRTNFEPQEIRRRIAGRDCWSSGKEWQCSNIGKLLKEMYPHKSKYE